MSAEFAVAENCTAGVHVPKRSVRLREIKALNASLNALNTLETLNTTLKVSENYFGIYDCTSNVASFWIST